jgi:2-aminoadipate transaminase
MFSKRTERLTGSLIREILAVAQQADIISFAGGLPATASLPKLDLDGMPGDLAQYGASEGEPRLRALVARYARGLGLSCQADQVLILSGSQQALDLTAKLFIDEGTPIVTEAPTYLAALQVFNLFGAEIHGVEQRDGVLDPAALDAALQTSKARMAYLIPSFQNPSGACYDARLRQRLAEVLDRSDAVVIEDDPYRELSFNGPAPVPLVAGLQKAPWVYCGSFSKTLAPGLRLGFLIASSQLFLPLLRLKQAVDLHSNRPGQWLVSNWLEGGAYIDRLDRLRVGYRARRDSMQQSLERHFAPLADWQVPQGGLFFWLRLKRRFDTRERLQQALARQVLFMPGEAFYPEPERGLGHIRLNFSHATPEKIEEGIARLAEVFADCVEA